jgi:hypothetical protein
VSNHVTLLQDLDAGKNCCHESAAAIRHLESENATLQSELDSTRAELARAKGALINEWAIEEMRVDYETTKEDGTNIAEARYENEIINGGV